MADSQETSKTITSLQIAQLIHENNRLFQKTVGQPVGLPWNELAESAKVNLALAVDRCIEHRIYQSQDGCRIQHDLWLEEKLTDGWKYGPCKDERTKEHPCCVPYHMLSADDRQKDVFFLTIAGMWAPYSETQRKIENGQWFDVQEGGVKEPEDIDPEDA